MSLRSNLDIDKLNFFMRFQIENFIEHKEKKQN